MFAREHPFSHQFSNKPRLSGGTGNCFLLCQRPVLLPALPAPTGHQEIAFIAIRDVTEPSKAMIRGCWNCQCGMFN